MAPNAEHNSPLGTKDQGQRNEQADHNNQSSLNHRSGYAVDSTPDTHFPATDHQETGIGASEKVVDLRSALGLEAKAPIDAEHDAHPNSELFWPRVRMTLREPFAEFWGVFVMIMFGNGSVAQVLLSEKTSAPGGYGFGDYQSISWG